MMEQSKEMHECHWQWSYYSCVNLLGDIRAEAVAAADEGAVGVLGANDRDRMGVMGDDEDGTMSLVVVDDDDDDVEAGVNANDGNSFNITFGTMELFSAGEFDEDELVLVLVCN